MINYFEAAEKTLRARGLLEVALGNLERKKERILRYGAPSEYPSADMSKPYTGAKTVGQYDTMANRCAASDKFNADLHVPIHTNGCNGVASGTRIFCFSSDKDSAGYKAAKAVFDVLAPFTPGKSENIKEYPGLFEVRTPKAPTVYIEVDFHDVPAVAKWIIENAEGIGEKIAEGLCDALDVAYKAPDTNATDIPADGDTGTEATGKTLYRVQVGAFSVKENAENFLREVKALGLSNAFITEVKV